MDESNTRPIGSDGLTVQAVITPPRFVGFTGVIVEFIANDKKLGV